MNARSTLLPGLCLFVGLLVSSSFEMQYFADRVSAQVTEITSAIVVNGKERSFTYVVSQAAAPANGRPLVIHLHGDGGNMGLSGAWKDAVLNDNNGAVLLSAQGRNNIPEAAVIDGSGWRFRMDEAGREYDDIDFIAQLIDEALNANRLGTQIDPDQVYLVGESRGAGFAYFLYADPRTSNKIRAIVPISGTFYCDGQGLNQGQPNAAPAPGNDLTCGEIVPNGWWGPRPALFEAPNVTREAHILDIHGQISSGEFPHTAPPTLDTSWAVSTWAGWGNAVGCDTEQVRSLTGQTLPYTVNGKTIKSYAYSQSSATPAQRCALDLTFYIVQGGGHVPAGFEKTAWCYLSGVGGDPSAHACAQQNGTPTSSTTPTTPTSSTTPSTPTSTTPSPSPSATPTIPTEQNKRLYLSYVVK
jgi:poly(3-hydroxybutyrate) depolymerase